MRRLGERFLPFGLLETWMRHGRSGACLVLLLLVGCGNGENGSKVPGMELCGGTTLVNLQTDPLHCGSCTNVCSGATPLCSSGTCASSCRTGQTLCGSSCVDLQTDSQHCGECGKVCGAGQVCVSGDCMTASDCPD